VTFVVDCSVSLAWCFEDEQDPFSVQLLHRAAASGAVAPSLWPLEAVNGLWRAERRGRIDARQRQVFIDLLRGLPIQIDPTTHEQAWDSTAALAARHTLTAYDAAYLELAARRRLPLASRDAALAEAARAAGVEVVAAA
jgi:predicted nucleic acid-binding protein